MEIVYFLIFKVIFLIGAFFCAWTKLAYSANGMSSGEPEKEDFRHNTWSFRTKFLIPYPNQGVYVPKTTQTETK